MSKEDISIVDIFFFAASLTEQIAKIADDEGFSPAETTMIMAQALAMTIEKNALSGHRKTIASDMAAVVASYPPILNDQPINEAVH